MQRPGRCPVPIGGSAPATRVPPLTGLDGNDATGVRRRHGGDGHLSRHARGGDGGPSLLPTPRPRHPTISRHQLPILPFRRVERFHPPLIPSCPSLARPQSPAAAPLVTPESTASGWSIRRSCRCSAERDFGLLAWPSRQRRRRSLASIAEAPCPHTRMPLLRSRGRETPQRKLQNFRSNKNEIERWSGPEHYVNN